MATMKPVDPALIERAERIRREFFQGYMLAPPALPAAFLLPEHQDRAFEALARTGSCNAGYILSKLDAAGLMVVPKQVGR